MPSARSFRRASRSLRVTFCLLLTLFAVLIVRWIQEPLRRNALFAAVRANDEHSVLALARTGVDVNARDMPNPRMTLWERWNDAMNGNRNRKRGPTPLLLALVKYKDDKGYVFDAEAKARPNINIARALLESGADPDVKDSLDGRPLRYAIQAGDVDMARLLLEHGAKPDEGSEPRLSPLMEAAAMGKPDMARVLLEHGANVNLPEPRSKMTPLHYAARYGASVPNVRLLLEHHADTTLKDIWGHTPYGSALAHIKAYQARHPKRTAKQETVFQHIQEVAAVLKQAEAK